MEAKQIGTVLPAAMEPAPAAMHLVRSSTDSLRNFDLASLPERLDDATLATMRELAVCPLPPMRECDEGSFLEAMATMQASLPRRSSDQITAEIQVATYRKIIGTHPKVAIEFLAATAIREQQWFPTPKECLDILARWERADGWTRKRSAVRQRIGSELEARMAETMAALTGGPLDPAEIDAIPDRWKAIAETRGLLRKWPDGSFTQILPFDPADETAKAAVWDETARWRTAWAAFRAGDGT